MDVKKLEKRLQVFTAVVVCVFIFLTTGLSMLQIVKGDEYEKLAQENRIRLIPITAPRGTFKDRFGRDLVNSRPSFTVSYMNVNSKKEEQEEVFKILSDILKIQPYTDVSNERYTIDENRKIYLNQVPVVDGNGDGRLDSGDVRIVEESTGRKVVPLKVDFSSGEIEFDLKPGTVVLASYRYDTFKNKIRDQGYKKYMPVRLKTDVDFQTIARIEERRLPGVVIEVEPIRNYIYGNIGSHIYGYVGEINREELNALKDKGYRPGDLIGKMGLEKVLEPYLKGKDGGQQVEVTATGKPIKVLGTQEPVPGATVNLTIDARIQQVAENALREQMLKLQTDRHKPFPNAKRGAVVALNVKTGEILAMVSLPDFDPNMFARGITQKEWNELSRNPLKPMVNLAVAGTYPPGSVFKMVTATAALEKKVTTEKEYIYDPGVYWTIAPKKDWKPGGHGTVNIVKALAESCNIFFYEMGRRLGIDNIEKYARMYGLGNLTGIELPGEKAGTVASRKYKAAVFKRAEDKIWYPAETLDAAIGQGYHSFTPLQIADYVAAIANEGYWMKPHLIKSIVDASGKVILEKKPEVGGTVDVSKKTFEIIKKGMRQVVLPGGTAYSVFSDFPIPVAGKTGTAQWDLTKTPHGWFVAFAPFDDPEIAVVVFIEQAGSGGVTGGPVAKAILESYFHLNDNSSQEDYLVQP
ncbi:penicillin-binding protein 2 [Thermoanaerobacterium sp. DL9XJH110]|uniref:penicillin-binding protein 2 n=1 Tax=Thermoanaerobacterium sp. DL9XJH110 TaxID=3386643 RepID=UPI003BB6BDDA